MLFNIDIYKKRLTSDNQNAKNIYFIHTKLIYSCLSLLLTNQEILKKYIRLRFCCIKKLNIKISIYKALFTFKI